MKFYNEVGFRKIGDLNDVMPCNGQLLGLEELYVLAKMQTASVIWLLLGIL